MKINADIEVYNRKSPTAIIPNKRSEWSCLSIGYYQTKQDEIYILLQTQKNGVGVKYKVRENIEMFFTRNITYGKMMLRFQVPQDDLTIRTSVKELQKFYKLVKECRKNIPNRITKLTNLSNVPTKVCSKPQAKLHANCKKDIPLTDSFPPSIEIIQLNNAELNKIDVRIFRLQNLRILNLENNCLEVLPHQLSLLPYLRELHLANNMLGHSSLKKWLSTECIPGIVYLDLRQNEIRALPDDIYKLGNLTHLSLNDNLLLTLPNSFGLLSKLKELRLRNNRLIALPSSFRFLFLNVLDVSFNPRLIKNYAELPSTNENISLNLLDLSAEVVIRKKLYYNKRTLPQILITYLNNACFCICGAASFPPEPERYVTFCMARVAIKKTSSGCDVPIEVRYCSHRCRTKYDGDKDIWSCE